MNDQAEWQPGYRGKHSDYQMHVKLLPKNPYMPVQQDKQLQRGGFGYLGANDLLGEAGHGGRQPTLQTFGEVSDGLGESACRNITAWFTKQHHQQDFPVKNYLTH